MSFTIKKKIHWSFSLLVCLFVLNGIITIITINNNKKASYHISKVTHPSLKAIYDFRKMLLQSQMHSTNWVFLRSSQADKHALIKIHTKDYPELKTKLLSLSASWYHQEMADSLKKMLSGFENLMLKEKYIMNSLEEFDDYDDPVKKFGAEEQLENIILPQTSELMNLLYKVLAHEEEIRVQEEAKLDHSSRVLRAMISVLAIMIILIGIFLSVYLSRIIIRPIVKIRDIVNDLGKGVINKVNYKANGNEIGDMVRSVNNLSEKLQLTAAFAREIGKRNFNMPFEPMSNDDSLGKALIAMRDNLKSSDESLNEAQQIAHLGSWERDFKNKKLFWSDELFRIFDAEPSAFDAAYETYLNLIHPEDKEFVNGFASRYMQDHQPFSYECRIITQKGVNKTIYVQGKVIADEQGKVIKTYGIIQDVTERKQTEKNLIRSEVGLKEAQAIAHTGSWEIDLTQNLVTWSDEAYNIYGLNIGEVQPSVELFLSFMHPDDKDMARNTVQEAFDMLKDSSFYFRFIRKDGTVRYGYTEWKFDFDKNKKPVRLYGIQQDITERKEAEKKLEQQNQELKKTNAELDEFVYSVSHDLRAPLTSMLGIVEISEQITQENSMREHLGMLKGSINRLDGFIKDILDYSRNARTEVHNEKINFTEILNDITDNLKFMSGINRKVDIQFNVSNGVHFCSDKNRLSVVLNNLISNSIRYQNPEEEKPFVNVNVNVLKKEALITVKDNGVGISKENHKKIFDMFFRIAENSVGSGLGLYIVKETVNKLHGDIQIESQPGSGTMFQLVIPNLLTP